MYMSLCSYTMACLCPQVAMGFFFLRHDTAGDGYVVVNGIEVYNMCPDTTALDVYVS